MRGLTDWDQSRIFPQLTRSCACTVRRRKWFPDGECSGDIDHIVEKSFVLLCSCLCTE